MTFVPQMTMNPAFDSELRTVQRRSERNAVRWYVMVLPAVHRGMVTGLDGELERRRRDGEPLFEYFAPTFVEVRKVEGRLTESRKPLLYNYLFIRSSESEIFRLKQRLPQYNFLPRVRDGRDGYHYPYLSDEAMSQLQWISRSYSGSVPICEIDPSWLAKGDRVRITDGRFKGTEARVAVTPDTNCREIVVEIDRWMCVPLFKVQRGEYEIIELSGAGGRLYTQLGNDRLQQHLHEALCRHIAGSATDEDRTLAADTLQRFAGLRVESEVMRCKLCALLLPAAAIVADSERCGEIEAVIRLLLATLKAEQSRALLLLTLYGCTDNSLCHDELHALVAPWLSETSPKRSKAQILARMADYDRLLGHTANS